MKVGEIRYEASVHEGKVEYSEWHLRTIQSRRRGKYAYWVIYLRHVTWVKLSKSHGHWGWKRNVPDWCRHRARFDEKRPFHPNKPAALRQALRDAKAYIREWGDGDEFGYTSADVAILERAVKRIRP